MEPKISTLDIQLFRAIRHLRIESLRQVNLVTGKNNTGKSSVLEGLRILASDASLTTLSEILNFREEDGGETDDRDRGLDPEGFFPLSSLFHGHPDLSENLQPIVITSTGRQDSKRLSLNVDWIVEEEKSDGTTMFVRQQRQLFGEAEAVPALVIEADGRSRIIPFERFRRLSHRSLRRSDVSDQRQLPCMFVSPYGGARTAALGPLWDKIALSDYENDVVDALRIIDPNITAVSMVGGESPRGTRTAIVRTMGIARPVPLRSFGDGLNRLFGIVLSLVNAKGGLLLIDEFENSMHHTVQTDVWRTIFKLARRLDVQVVATSHSWDAIEAFQKAATEDPEEGALIRLSRKDEDIITTMFSEDELTIATRDRIEVR